MTIVGVDIRGGNKGQGTTAKVNTRETKQRRKKNHRDENRG